MSTYEELDSMIRESYTPSVKELIMLWNKMGLSTEEVETRMTTVVMKISDIVSEMVKCDRENKRKIEDACDDLKKDVSVMWRTLKKSGEQYIVIFKSRSIYLLTKRLYFRKSYKREIVSKLFP